MNATGVSDPGEFDWEHMHHVKLILSLNLSTFLTFILGAPISYYPRERKEGRGRGWKFEYGLQVHITDKFLNSTTRFGSGFRIKVFLSESSNPELGLL